jgi:hypothetical protein
MGFVLMNSFNKFVLLRMQGISFKKQFRKLLMAELEFCSSKILEVLIENDACS